MVLSGMITYTHYAGKTLNSPRFFRHWPRQLWSFKTRDEWKLGWNFCFFNWVLAAWAGGFVSQEVRVCAVLSFVVLFCGPLFAHLTWCRWSSVGDLLILWVTSRWLEFWSILVILPLGIIDSWKNMQLSVYFMSRQVNKPMNGASVRYCEFS